MIQKQVGELKREVQEMCLGKGGLGCGMLLSVIHRPWPATSPLGMSVRMHGVMPAGRHLKAQ